MIDRLRNHGYKLVGMGALWSLYRARSAMHCRMVEAAGRGLEPLCRLPKPFERVIPNAVMIAQATEVKGSKPASFRQKYTAAFSKLYESLCEEIVQRAEWRRARLPKPQLEVFET